MPENHKHFGAPGETEPPLLDVLASNARTAMDDPDGLHDPPRWDGNLSYSSESMRRADLSAYVVNRMDEIIETLNPTTPTREGYAATLTMLGRHLAERQDTIEFDELSYREHDPETMQAYEDAHDALGRALDALDEAINALTPASEEDDDHPPVTYYSADKKIGEHRRVALERLREETNDVQDA